MTNVEALSDPLKPYDARRMRVYPVRGRVNKRSLMTMGGAQLLPTLQNWKPALQLSSCGEARQNGKLRSDREQLLSTTA